MTEPREHRIEFSVLGPLRVTGAGRPVEVGPGRRRATLAALLVDANRVVALDTLVDRVWDEPPASPITSVHTYVSRLRAALRTVDHDGVEVAAALLTEAPGYRLAIDPEAIDVVRFENALRQARELRAQQPGRAREMLARALSLWRGVPYADVSSMFIRSEAERLLTRRVDAQELMVQCDLDLGRHVEVLPDIEEMVVAEPWREPRHGALMLALYRAGRQVEALRHFEELRNSLADELGVDPSRELQDLHRRILRQDATLNITVSESVTTTSPSAGPIFDSEGAEGLPPLRMVGRNVELEQVEAALGSAWHGGELGAAVVAGEAGIGKSRLVEEAANRAAREGVLVTWGRSWQHEGAPLLWPWLQVVRGVLAQLGKAEIDSALQGRAAGVRRLLPELAAPGPPHSPDAPGPDPDWRASLEESQVQLFDAVTEFLSSVATTRRLLVVLEDLHWGDLASRRLLEYFLTHAGPRGPAVAVTVRTPNEDAAVPVRELLASLARTGRTKRVPLTGLAMADIQRYVADRTGSQLDGPTAQALVDRTEGNPFFVGEIVQLLVTEAGSYHSAVVTSVPESVRETVLRRLQLIGGTELGILQAAAVVGRDFDLEVVREVSGGDEDTVDEAVDKATAAGFLRSGSGGLRQHRFTHALVQQALVEDVGPARRRRLHAAAAHALTGQDLGAPRDADQLIYHLGQAGSNESLSQAVDLGIQVADAALRSSNHPEVEAVLLRALEHVTGIEGEEGPTRELSVRVRLCSLYDWSYGPGYPPSVAHRERALDLARHSTSHRDRVAALSSADSRALTTADFVAVAANCAEMVVSSEALDEPVLRVAALLSEGIAGVQRGRFRAAVETLTKARALLRDVDVPDWAAEVMLTPLDTVHGWRLLAQVLAGQPITDPDVQSDLVTSQALAKSAVPVVQANAAGNLALVHIVLDQPQVALDFVQRAVQVAMSTEMAAVRDYFSVFEVWADVRASREQIERAALLIDPPPTMLMRPFLRDLIADAHLRAGRIADARRWHTLALTEAELTGNWCFAPGPTTRLRNI